MISTTSSTAIPAGASVSSGRAGARWAGGGTDQGKSHGVPWLDAGLKSPKKAEAALRPISAPTLVIWGQRDHYLGPELAEPDHDDVPNFNRVERLPDASHWVHHDEAKQVTQLLTDFFAPALPAKNR